jgi:hypothetical protein
MANPRERIDPDVGFPPEGLLRQRSDPRDALGFQRGLPIGLYARRRGDVVGLAGIRQKGSRFRWLRDVRAEGQLLGNPEFQIVRTYLPVYASGVAAFPRLRLKAIFKHQSFHVYFAQEDGEGPRANRPAQHGFIESRFCRADAELQKASKPLKGGVAREPKLHICH